MFHQCQSFWSGWQWCHKHYFTHCTKKKMSQCTRHMRVTWSIYMTPCLCVFSSLFTVGGQAGWAIMKTKMKSNSDKRSQMKAEGICDWGDSQIWKVEDTLPKSQCRLKLLKGVNLSETVSVCLSLCHSLNYCAAFVSLDCHVIFLFVLILPLCLLYLCWVAAVPLAWAVFVTCTPIPQLQKRVAGQRVLAQWVCSFYCSSTSVLQFVFVIFLLSFTSFLFLIIHALKVKFPLIVTPWRMQNMICTFN